jgi:hypothetical protein
VGKGALWRTTLIRTASFRCFRQIEEVTSQLWVKALKADGNFGHWQYPIARKPEDVNARFDAALANISE